MKAVSEGKADGQAGEPASVGLPPPCPGQDPRWVALVRLIARQAARDFVREETRDAGARRRRDGGDRR